MYKFIFLFFLSFSAVAEEFDFTWRDEDTVRATILVLEHAIDANQTKHFATNCVTTGNAPYYAGYGLSKDTRQTTCTEVYESQSAWILGKHPSNQTINLYFIALSALEIYISSELPQGWRDVFQYIRIIDTGNTINENHRQFGASFNIGF